MVIWTTIGTMGTPEIIGAIGATGTKGTIGITGTKEAFGIVSSTGSIAIGTIWTISYRDIGYRDIWDFGDYRHDNYGDFAIVGTIGILVMGAL